MDVLVLIRFFSDPNAYVNLFAIIGAALKTGAAVSIREALRAKGIIPCIPPKKNRKEPIFYDKHLYKQRNRIEIMFGRLKDWRRIAMRYDRCAHTFFSAICLAAVVIFYLN